MKNLFKISLIAITLAVSVYSCAGDRSGSHPDTTHASAADSTNAVNAAGANGADNAIDTGLDNSGSGGTSTIKKQ